MSQLNTMLERVALLQSGISIGAGPGMSITSAFPYAPSDPSVLECPFFVNELKGGPSSIFAVTGLQQLRCMVGMVMCYAPTWSDINAMLLQQNTIGLIDAVFSTFAAKVELGGDLGFIHDAFIVSWGEPRAPEPYRIGESIYSAVRFILRVNLIYTQTVHA